MIRIKAIAAIVLTGLGGATVGTDVYLASRSNFSPPESAEPRPVRLEPVTVRADPLAPAVAPATDTVVTLEPFTIYARTHTPAVVHEAAAAPAPAQELIACSNWRSLDTGPAGRGVRTLCVPGATP